MSEPSEQMLYEVLWRCEGEGKPFPFPWWAQQYFRHWLEAPAGNYAGYDKYSGFVQNVLYRYWNLVGVKDHHQECLVGQAGEVMPVVDPYTFVFFLFDPANRQLHFPQTLEASSVASPLEQSLDQGYLPVVQTDYRSPGGIEIHQKVLATTVGVRQRGLGLVRFKVQSSGPNPADGWLCLTVLPFGPNGLQSRRLITNLQYLPTEQRVKVGTFWGPAFDQAPAS